MAFLKPLPVVVGHRIVRPSLDPNAAHHPGNNASAGDYVGHRDLFSQPYRVIAGWQHIAQNENLSPLGNAAKHSGREIDRHIHARRRIVMLIDHQTIKAHLFGPLILIKIIPHQAIGGIGIKICIGKRQPHRRVILRLPLIK